MKQKLANLALAVLFILSNNLISNGQQPTVRSSVISFFDIVKYSKQHPDLTQGFIDNHKVEEEEREEVLPILKIKNPEAGMKDPYGIIRESSNKYAGNTTNAAPAPFVSFNVIDDNQNYIPPDVHGAVGPNHVMTTLNSQVRIQNLTGGVISTVTLAAVINE